MTTPPPETPGAGDTRPDQGNPGHPDPAYQPTVVNQPPMPGGYSAVGTPGPGAPNPGYTNPGYAAPGYTNPGYATPGYPAGGYPAADAGAAGYPPAAPGYGAPSQGTPGYGAPGQGTPGYGAPGQGNPGYPAAGYGAPGYPPGYGAPLPSGPKKSRTGLIVGLSLGAVLVLIVAAFALTALLRSSTDRSADSEAAASATPYPDSTSPVDINAIGDCVVLSGSGMTSDARGVSCSDTSQVSFIIGDKRVDSDTCKSAGYEYFFTDYGAEGTDRALCLIPNYLQGTCYEESTLPLGIDLSVVDCSKGSLDTTVRYRITERVDSLAVPNCSDPDKQKAFTHQIHTDPVRAIGFCAEILGDYVWK